jgi:hypothetical protein
MLLLFESFTTTHKGEGLALDAKAKEVSWHSYYFKAKLQ